MVGNILTFLRKPDSFGGNWGGRKNSAAIDPERNWIALLRFAGILLRDQRKTEVTTAEIFDCIKQDLRVPLSAEEGRQIQHHLMTHPSFVQTAGDRYAVV